MSRFVLPRSVTSLSLVLAAFALGACTTDATGKSSGASTGAGGPPGAAGADTTDARFFLPTGDPDNTAAPRVATDAEGNVHAVYPAYAGGGAYYAFCPRGCAKSDDVEVVRFESHGTVANAMIALDAAGHPRVLLADFSTVAYAECDADCGKRASWTLTTLFDHGSDREVTGEAFALDPKGRPRFLMHTYRAYLGIGQKPRETDYVLCDADCTKAASWRQAKIADQTWESASLVFDAKGGAHAAVVATGNDDGVTDLAAYVECRSDCENPDAWVGTGLMTALRDETAIVRIEPAVSLALTKDGAPRVLVLGKSQDGKNQLAYHACDADCTKAQWTGMELSNSDKLGAGVDLALDAADHPRYVYSIDGAILMGRCDADECESDGDAWKLTKVEAGWEMPPDQIFLYPNCTVGMWWLHGPSLALGPDGAPRVGYQARDLSGGTSRPDPTAPACVAGTDMTWTRLALVGHME